MQIRVYKAWDLMSLIGRINTKQAGERNIEHGF